MIAVNNICLSYSYKTVLSGVSTQFEDGKIYALLGENGAGKSTLAHIICGDKIADSGHLEVDGKNVSFSCPKDALNYGIACVHQRPLLADCISIRENLLIGASKQAASQIDDYIAKWLPEVKASTLVKKLSASQRFFVSLCGILLKNPKTLILDEPSSLLDENQREYLFNQLRTFAECGMTVIIITHFLAEALEKTDHIVLLKDGKIICEEDSSRITEEQIHNILYIEESDSEYTEEEEITILKSLENVDYHLCRNETELEQLEEKLISQAEKKSTGIIPSDRNFRASNPSLTILQLLTAQKISLKEHELCNFAEDLKQKADINIKLTEKCSNLSGGMLQRLIWERELAKNPEKLLLCEPFQGLDVEAVRKTLQRIISFAKQGIEITILTTTPVEKIL